LSQATWSQATWPPARHLHGPPSPKRINGRLRRSEQTARTRAAREIPKGIQTITHQVDALERELRLLILTYRERAEGKSNREALRCLKRHLARHVHRLLTMPPATLEPRTPIQLKSAISVGCLTPEQYHG